MTRLSVNINKIATIRNARGGNNPNVLKVAQDCERFGAQGITVHPRPDERHIRYNDVIQLPSVINQEFNIEGFPDERYLKIIGEVRPAQATLVPDGPDVLTSNAGWQIRKEMVFLKEIVAQLKSFGARVSLFIDPDPEMALAAKEAGADRVELYTEPYAALFHKNREEAVKPYIDTAEAAKTAGLGINAGHDLDLSNLQFLKESIPFMDEVSIGHALICDALYYGLENTIQLYLRQLTEINE